MLNESVPQNNDPENEEFIIGGKLRKGKYGTELRKHDPIAFEASYQDWKR